MWNLLLLFAVPVLMTLDAFIGYRKRGRRIDWFKTAVAAVLWLLTGCQLFLRLTSTVLFK